MSSLQEQDKEVENLVNPENDTLEMDTTYPVKIQAARDRYSFFDLKRKIDEYKEIDLQPEFQRNLVWTVAQQSLLIESILMDIPLPMFYFAQTKSGKVSVVDGIQRITTVLRYMKDEFAITKSKYFPKVEGKKFSALERAYQANIEKYQIDAYIIPVGIPERVKIDIFDRINKAGTQLNAQELRHALYIGISTRLLKELAEKQIFKNATGDRLNKYRMRDRYVILRFLAFYLWKHQDDFSLTNSQQKTEITSGLDSFLGNYMQIINTMPNDDIERLKEIFLHTMQLVYNLFANNAFTKGHESKMPFNMMIFDSLCYVLASEWQNDSIDKDALQIAVAHIENDFILNQAERYSPASVKAIKAHFATLDSYLPLIKE